MTTTITPTTTTPPVTAVIKIHDDGKSDVLPATMYT
jgi:hypothetical protein